MDESHWIIPCPQCRTVGQIELREQFVIGGARALTGATNEACLGCGLHFGVTIQLTGELDQAVGLPAG